MRALGLVVLAALVFSSFAGCLAFGTNGGQGKGDPSEPRGQQKDKAGKHAPFSNTSVFPGNYRFEGRFSRTLQDGPEGIGSKELATLQGAQGAAIQVGYVRPKDPGNRTFPVVIAASPYFAPLSTTRFEHASNPTQIVDFLVQNYVPHGYAVAFIPVRGTAGNGGCYGWWSANERADLETALKWIIAQPWSDGNLAMIGLSLGGSTAWMAAGSRIPELKTIVPVSSETDFYTWFVRHGSPGWASAPAGASAFWGILSLAPFTLERTGGRTPEQAAGSLDCPEAREGQAAGGQIAATGAIDTLGYAAARDLRPKIEQNYQGSIFLIHGFQDWLAMPHLVQPWVQSLEDRGIVVKQLWGQWRHRMPDSPAGGDFFNPTARYDFAEILLHWLDYWLKGKKDTDLGPRVQVADTSRQWRNEDAWPPRDATPTSLRLSNDGSLTGASATSGSKILSPDPRRTAIRINQTGGDPKSDCPQCHYFTGAALPTDLRISGIPEARLTVTPLGAAGTVTAWLYLQQGTTHTRVAWATMDLRFNGTRTSPATLTPGTATTITLTFEPVEILAPKGSSLVLELSQAGYGEDFGVFLSSQALAPFSYYRSALPPNPVQVELGGDKSRLLLPTVSRDGSSFFTPPARP